MARKKAPNGAGSIRYCEGKRLWRARITTGTNPGTGKPITRDFYGKTQAEVRKKLTASACELDTGTYLPPERITVSQWLKLWLEDYLGDVKPSTAAKYAATVRTHLMPAFGAVRLQELNAPMIQHYYNKVYRSGISAPKTIRDIHGILHRALAQAIDLQYIRFNPCDACKLPRVEHHETKPFTSDNVGAFLEAIKGNPYESLYLVALFTGMRQGEVLGLAWRCVDFDAGTICIEKQLQKERQTGLYKLVSIKNDKPRVTMPPRQVMDELRRVRAQQRANRLRLGPAWSNPFDLVFTHEDGTHLCAPTVYENFKRIAKRLGSPETRFHDLRHSYTTICEENGVPIETVSRSLGHATAAFTQQVYGHLTPRMLQEGAERISSYIESIK